MRKREIPGHSALVMAASAMMGGGIMISLPYLEGHTMSLVKGVVLFALGVALMLSMIFFFSPRR